MEKKDLLQQLMHNWNQFQLLKNGSQLYTSFYVLIYAFTKIFRTIEKL